MERDPNIIKYFRESGIVPAPERFTRDVMEKIDAEPEKTHFKPLIGRTGRILILLFIAGLVLISIFYGDTGASASRFQLPEISLQYDFLKEINLSTGLLAAMVAIFILVLSDAGFRRKRFA